MNPTLYECSKAKVRGEHIFCAAGHRLCNLNDGTINIRRLERGDPLKFAICRDCPDYDSMEPPVPAKEMGWV